MYFLSDLEHKLLVQRLLPQAREVGVSPELRGWEWYKPPLKPYHETFIPMYNVCSKYCDTGRDVYLRQVQKIEGESNYNITLGLAVHKTVSQAFSYAKKGLFEVKFEEWWVKNAEERLKKKVEPLTGIKERCKAAWDFVQASAKASYLNATSQQPYATKENLLASSIPFLTEHRLSGRLLGLSGLLGIDCYDYLHCIVFDIKVGIKDIKENLRLYPTGYALVLESNYEIPIDIGCTVYVTFRNTKVLIRRDLFIINDDLRSWWIEERDNKAKMVAEKIDPGIPKECWPNCMYIKICKLP